jgi:hypothetical protein
VDDNSTLHDDLRGQSAGIEVIPDWSEPALAQLPVTFLVLCPLPQFQRLIRRDWGTISSTGSLTTIQHFMTICVVNPRVSDWSEPAHRVERARSFKDSSHLGPLPVCISRN